MKARGISILLCLALVLSTGCGAPKENGGAAAPAQSTSVSVDDVLDVKDETERPFSVGRTEGKTYINECFDIQCTVDDTWTVFGEAELIDLYNKTYENYSDNIKLTSMEERVVENVLTKRNAEIPLLVTAGNTGSVMIYVLKEFKDYQKDYEGYMEDYIERLTAEFTATGRKNVTGELSTATFRGETVDCVDTSYEQNGVTYYQKTVLLFEGNYRATVMAFSFTSFDDAQRILDRFGTSTEPAVIVQAESMPVEAKIYM